MHLMDRDIGYKSLRYYSVILAIATGLLLLENAPRVLQAGSSLGQPLVPSLLVLAGLLPEYAAVSGMFSIFFAGALLAYRSQRRNELVSWMALGIPTWRMTAAFTVLALGNAAMILAMLGWLQPRGELLVARVDQEIAKGLYGFSLQSGELTPIGKDSMIAFEWVDRRTGHLKGVFVKLPTRSVSAHDARIAPAPNNALLLNFNNGVVIDEAADSQPQALGFEHLEIVIDGNPSSAPVIIEPFQKLVSLDRLITLANDQNAPATVRQVAKAEAAYRLLVPALSLCFGALGFLLGIPGKTVGSAGGVLVGTASIVLFVRLANLGRGTLSAWTIPWSIGIACIAFALCWLIASLNNRLEPGFIDLALTRRLRLLRRRIVTNRRRT